VKRTRPKPVLTMEEIARLPAGSSPALADDSPGRRACGICGQFTTSMTGYCSRTPECKGAAERRYREIRPEVKRQAAKRWRDNHPAEARASERRHRQKVGRTCRFAECENVVNPGQTDCPDCQAARGRAKRAELVRRDGPLCSWCGGPLPADLAATEIDHIIPVSLGGPRDPQWNKQILHETCNRAKLNSVTDRALEVATQHGYKLSTDGHRPMFFREQWATAMVYTTDR